MSLIYFDGFDQYVPVTTPSDNSTAESRFSYGGAVPNTLKGVTSDPHPVVISGASAFARIYGDDRVWRVQSIPVTTTTGGAAGIAKATWGVGTNVTGELSSGNGVILNALGPVSALQNITLGYKSKMAVSNPPSTTVFHLLAAFSVQSTFSNENQSFGITLEGGNKVCVRKLYGEPANQRVYQRVFPTGVFEDDVTTLGVCNFVMGTLNSTATLYVPSIEQVPSNTVEVQYTVDGRITVWINNAFVGTTKFIDPTPLLGVQYVGTGTFGYQYYSGGVQNGFIGITDLYLLNGLGTRNTGRLGKVKVVSRSPQTDASVALGRPDTYNTNAEVVSQLPAQTTPSLTGATDGDTDLYGSTAFNFTNEAIIATSVVTTGYKTDPSGNDIAPVLNVTGTNYVGNTNVVPVSNTTMKQEQHIYELNPKTGLPFTKAELDATTFGVTVVSPSV